MVISAWRSRRKGGWISSGLSGRLVQQGGMFLVALVLFCTGCQDATTTTPRLEAVTYTDDGIELSLPAPAPGATLEVQTEDGVPVQSLTLQSADLAPRLLFPWKSDQSYRFRLERTDERTGQVVATAPVVAHAPVKPPIRAVLRLPYGQAEARLRPEGAGIPAIALASGGGSVQLGLEAALMEGPPLEVWLSLQLPAGVGTDGALEQRWRLGPTEAPVLPMRTLRLPTQEGDYPVTATLRYRVVGSTSPDQPPWQTLEARVVLVVRPPRALAGMIEVVDRHFPTDQRGRPEAQRMPDTVALPNPLWRALGTLFRAEAPVWDPYAPYAFQSATFANRTTWPITLLITAHARDVRTGEEAGAFVPRAFEVTGGTGTITTMARIPAHGQGLAIVPFYVRPEAAEGVYSNELEVHLLGSDQILYRLQRPLNVVRSDPRANLTLLVVTPLSLAGLLLFAVRYRRLISSFDARALTTIALFGALMFATGFLTDLLSAGLNVVLGPFNIVVGGVLYEILHHLVLATLILLYPRPGTAALVGLTHYLMRGLTTGQISPLDLLFVGSSLTYKEIALYVFGLTRGRPLVERLRERPRATRAAAVLAFGVAAGATAFTSLGLHTAFYRLFFAPWYVWATVLVGVLGPWPGVVMGLRFGETLNRVRD